MGCRLVGTKCRMFLSFGCGSVDGDECLWGHVARACWWMEKEVWMVTATATVTVTVTVVIGGEGSPGPTNDAQSRLSCFVN